jgi:hypothetical protein
MLLGPQPVKQIHAVGRMHGVPAHVRHGLVVRDRHNLAGDQAQAVVLAQLATVIEQQTESPRRCPAAAFLQAVRRTTRRSAQA